MKQTTLSAGSFDRYTKKTRGAVFLDEMNRVAPWPALCALIKPVYPEAGSGRPAVGLERMPRVYFLQNWFNSPTRRWKKPSTTPLSMREFVSIDLGREVRRYDLYIRMYALGLHERLLIQSFPKRERSSCLIG